MCECRTILHECLFVVHLFFGFRCFAKPRIAEQILRFVTVLVVVWSFGCLVVLLFGCSFGGLVVWAVAHMGSC